jgi:hypothetical protein
MKKLDKRGVAALEFCLVAGFLFTLIFAIFDLGIYAITKQSLQTLANAGARAWMICYAQGAIQSPPPDCTGDPLPDGVRPNKHDIAPFLYGGGLTPRVRVCLPTSPDCPVSAGAALTVRASQENFTMLMPIWGGVLDAPSAFTSIPSPPPAP